MSDSPAIHKLGQHLSDIQVAFVLAFDKVKVTQREIASLVKCSRKAVRNALANYTFETFKGRKPRRNYQRITTKDEDKTIEKALKHNSFLPLRDIMNLLPVKISEAPCDIDGRSLGWGVMLQPRNRVYVLQTLKRGCVGH